MRNIQTGKSIRRLAVGFLALAAFLVPAPLAAASGADGDERSPVIKLPGATGAEGIAAGEGSTFFAGDRLNGTFFRETSTPARHDCSSRRRKAVQPSA